MMEDINNALLHIKAKHNGEIPYKYGSQECAKLMHSYAEEYHKRKLKLLGIANVVESVCDCEKHISLFPNGQYRCTKCWEWWYR